MSIDYDVPRSREDHEQPAVIAELRPLVRRARDLAEDELYEPINLAGGELDGSELRVPVLPRQADEFVCDCCFLIHHRSQAGGPGPVCAECA
jgi:hypothetical protein